MNEYDGAVSYDTDTFNFEKPNNGWAGVDTNRVKALVVYNKANPAQQYVVRCEEGMRPIFYETTQIVVKQLVNDEGELIQEPQAPQRVTCFGWQKTVNGTNVKSLVRIMHDGSVVISDHDPLQ